MRLMPNAAAEDFVDPDYQAAPRSSRSIFRSRWPLVVLLALTVLAGALRFIALDHPAIWGDEAATAGRSQRSLGTAKS